MCLSSFFSYPGCVRKSEHFYHCLVPSVLQSLLYPVYLFVMRSLEDVKKITEGASGKEGNFAFFFFLLNWVPPENLLLLILLSFEVLLSNSGNSRILAWHPPLHTCSRRVESTVGLPVQGPGAASRLWLLLSTHGLMIAKRPHRSLKLPAWGQWGRG